MTTTADDVWQLLGELIAAQKETERIIKDQSQETDRRFQETERRFQETERRFQETEKLLKEQWKETDRRFQETDRKIKEVSKQIGELGNRLGEFVEWQVRPSAIRLFRERGIEVHRLYSDVSVQEIDGGLEIDLLAVNKTEVVLVEVKSKLSQKDVDEHIERLEKFKHFMPEYQKRKALGAVAAMVVKEKVANYAYRQGLFVLTQSGENMTILNLTDFQPRVW